MGERRGVYGEDGNVKQIRIGIVLESASRCGSCPRILTAEQIGGNSDWCGAFGQPIHPVSPTSYIRLPECVAAEVAHRWDSATQQIIAQIGEVAKADPTARAIAIRHADLPVLDLTACLADMVKALVKEKKIAVENKGLF